MRGKGLALKPRATKLEWRRGEPFALRTANHPWMVSDTELMDRIAGGDRGAALEELVTRYSSQIFGLGLRLHGDRGTAEELVQDTFVRVWRSASRYDPDRGSVRTFVYAIARRAAIDQRRRVASRVLPTVEALEERPDTVEEYERLMTGLDVRAALQTLPEKHRETLELVYDEDLSGPQIAERLSIPVGTVKSRAHHALRALRKEMEGRGLVV